MTQNIIKYIEAKSILSKLNGRDPYFGISYNMNLYRGCQHGCIYCDTRSDCYGVGDISRIQVKKNAIELLGRVLASKRKKRATIGTGSMNDPYMPIESEVEITRKALKVIAEHKFPVHIITKGNLVTRDIDIIKDISKVYGAVSITITTHYDNLSSKIEPYAPVTSKRFKAIAQLAQNGIYAGVTMMPLLPFINDNSENIRNILKMASDSGAKYVIPMFGMTLRAGSRDFFLNALQEEFPLLKEKYQKTFGLQYVCWSPQHDKLSQVFNEESSRLGIPNKMEFYQPKEPQQLKLF
jgi:DNA repair photolyase